MSILGELKRRNVLRMAILYIVASWLIMQVSEVVMVLAQMPAWTGGVVLTVLAIGFPFALIFSWFFEMTPAGISLEDGGVSPGLTESNSGRRLDFVVIALLLAGLILFAFDKWWGRVPPVLSIAVLPFENLSRDPDQDFFSDGISEELLNLLAQIPELRVISRRSAFSFKNDNLEISEIAHRLNVAHVLEGSVRKSGDTIRITAQLIQAEDGFSLWSNSYDRKFQDIFVIQDEIANAIRDALQVTLDIRKDPVEARSPEAYLAYLKGRYFLNLRSGQAFLRALEQFELAIQIDANYASAYSGLADTYQLLGAYRVQDTEIAKSKSRAAAYRALELDDGLAEAHASVAASLTTHDWNWSAAAREFRRAIDINPNYGVALHWYGSLLAMMNDSRHLEMIKRAHAVDPVSLRVNVDLGLAYYYERDFERAERQLREALLLDSDFLAANAALGLVLVEVGAYEEAVAYIKKGAGDSLSIWLGYAYARAGNVGAAMDIAGKWETRWEESSQGAVELALIHLGLGQADQAFEWLDKAVEVRAPSLASIQAFAYWEPIRSDSRYTNLLRQLDFP